MKSRIKTKLSEIEKLVKDVLFDNQTGKLTTRYNEGAGAVADLQAFIDAQGFLTSGLQVSDIINNLTTSAANKALSAAQGVVLKSFIDNIMAILNSPDTALDDLQEIVAYIKQNKQDLQNLSISNIAGLVEALAEKEDAFTKNSAFNKNFGTLPGTVLEGNSWGNFISYVDNVARKDIRIDNGASVTLSTQDEVVIMTDNTAAIGTITIPDASELEGKEYWLIQHFNYATLSENYIRPNGSVSNVVFGAVHLKSDGTNWYQTNNLGSPNYTTLSGSGNVSVDGITKYKGTTVGTLTLPSPTPNFGRTLKIIAEKACKLSTSYIDTDGQNVDHTEEPLPAGSVIELVSSGETWEKIN